MAKLQLYLTIGLFTSTLLYPKFRGVEDYVFGCNNVIEKTILQYSEQKNPMVSPELPDQVLASRSLLISHTLLHDVILLEVRAYSLKYSANMKRKMLKRTEELNDLIEQKMNSDVMEDMDMVEVLKQEVQDIEDERDMAADRKYFTKMQLEGEKPTKFFSATLTRNGLRRRNLRSCTWLRRTRNGRRKSGW